MVISKNEKVMMNVIYAAAGAEGQCLLTPLELLQKIPYGVDFREDDLKPTLEALAIDGYFAFDVAKRDEKEIFCIVLTEKGKGYEREKKKSRRKIIKRIIVTVVFALLGYLVKVIIAAIIG